MRGWSDMLRRRGAATALSGLAWLFASGCGETPPGAPAPEPPRAAPAAPAQTRTEEAKPVVEGPFCFETLPADSGFVFERDDDIHGRHRITEANGGGVAMIDFDRDGRLDLFLTNGGPLPAPPGKSLRPSQLFRSVRGTQQEAGDAAGTALRFVPCAAQAGLSPHGFNTGCTVGDYDADGFDDLYICACGANSLWHNNGDGTLSDVTPATGTAVGQWSSSAAFGDVNLDGQLDLFVVRYLDESPERPRLCPTSDSPDGYVQCSPALFDGVDDVLLLSDGEGGFVDATAAAGLKGLRGKGLGVLISQLDEDPLPEIFVTNDGEANRLLDAEPELASLTSAGGAMIAVPRYVDRAMTSGVGLNESGFAQANMGIAAGDCDGNGTTDLLVTTFYNDTNTLFANTGGLQFEDATRRTRAGAGSRHGLGFGTLFFDADNDGWLDLFVANGHVDDRSRMKAPEPYRMRPLLYRNEGAGLFRELAGSAGAYFRSEWVGRGVAAGDLDGDGRLDLVVSHQQAPAAVIRNATAGGRSVSLRLVSRSGNRNGFGTSLVARRTDGAESATARLPIQFRELPGGGSFQSSSDLAIPVALRHEAQIPIDVKWPSGRTETFLATPGPAVAVEGNGVVSLPHSGL